MQNLQSRPKKARPESGEPGDAGQLAGNKSRSESPADQSSVTGVDPGNGGAKGHHRLPHIKPFASHPKQKERRPPPPVPRKSLLSHAEHIQYLDMFKKFMTRFKAGAAQPPSPQELQELQVFQRMHVTVEKEQRECQEYLKTMANHSPYLYHTVSPNVMAYLDNKEASGWQRNDQYPRYYKPPREISMAVTPVPNQPLPCLVLNKTLVTLGSKCRLHMPDLQPFPHLKNQRTVQMDAAKVAARFPPDRAKASGNHWNHQPASRDENMAGLVTRHRVHVATSGSVLQCLLATRPPDYSHAWDIPITVREHGEGSASRKVVYLDKPLLPERLSRADGKCHFLQKAVRTFMCQPSNNDRMRSGGGCSTRDASKIGSETSVRGVNTGNDNDPFGVSLDDLETFGSRNQFPQSHKKQQSNKTQQVSTIVNNMPTTGTSSLEKKSTAVTNEPNLPVVGETVADSNMEDEDNHGGKLEEIDAGRGSKDDERRIEVEGSLDEKSSSAHVGALSGSEESGTVDLAQSGSIAGGGVMSGGSGGSGGLQNQESLGVGFGLMDNSDSDSDSDGGLVIADASPIPSRAPVLRRSSRRSGSIFDAVPTPAPTQAPAPEPAKQTGVSPRRLTRSASHTAQPSSQAEAPKTETTDPPSSKKMKREGGDDGTSAASVLASAAAKKAAQGMGDKARRLSGGKSCSSTPLDFILKDMASVAAGKPKAEDPAAFLQPEIAGDGISYTLWDLAGISLLVRCNNHAFTRDFRQQQKAVYVRAKAERQASFGLEQVDLDECVHAWLGVYLRPHSSLLRARVNMQTLEVVHIDDLQPEQILQPGLNYSPQFAFMFLHKILSTLTELPVGSYLLSHAAGSDSIQLRENTENKRGSFDLLSRYMGVSLGEETEKDRAVPWLPLDPTYVLSHHTRSGVIPVTFQPPDFEKKGKQQQQWNQGNQQKQRNNSKRGKNRNKYKRPQY